MKHLMLSRAVVSRCWDRLRSSIAARHCPLRLAMVCHGSQLTVTQLTINPLELRDDSLL